MSRLIWREWRYLLPILLILILSGASACLSGYFSDAFLSAVEDELATEAWIDLGIFAALYLLSFLLLMLENHLEIAFDSRIQDRLLRHAVRRRRDDSDGSSLSSDVSYTVPTIVESYVSPILNIFYSVSLVIMGTGILAWIDLWSLLVMAELLVLSSLTYFLIQRGIGNTADRDRESTDRFIDFVSSLERRKFALLSSLFSLRLRGRAAEETVKLKRDKVWREDRMTSYGNIIYLPSFLSDCAFLVLFVIAALNGDIDLPLISIYVLIQGFISNACQNLLDSVADLRYGREFVASLFDQSEEKDSGGEERGDSIALRDVVVDFQDVTLRYDLELDPRSKYLITGDNGAGKSTLLKLIFGEIEPTSGELITLPDGSISYMDQSPYIFRENLDFNLMCSDRSAAESLLAELGFSAGRIREIGAMDDVTECSEGEKRRIALARAILSGATFVLLDEPLNNIDSESKADIVEFLKSYEKGFAVVSHSDIGQLRDAVDREIVIG